MIRSRRQQPQVAAVAVIAGVNKDKAVNKGKPGNKDNRVRPQLQGTARTRGTLLAAVTVVVAAAIRDVVEIKAEAVRAAIVAEAAQVSRQQPRTMQQMIRKPKTRPLRKPAFKGPAAVD